MPDDRISGDEMRMRVSWGAGIAIGMGSGVAIGAALDNMAVGIAIGVAIGVVFALLIGMPRRRPISGSSKANDEPEDPEATDGSTD